MHESIKNSKNIINDFLIKSIEQQNTWVLSFSGGKDSTLLLDLTINCIYENRFKNFSDWKLYVISSDTLVENPIVTQIAEDNLKKIQKFSIDNNLPIIVQIVKPEIKDSFWVNLIGKGYPAPNQNFRWCTSRLKINPISKYLEQFKYKQIIHLVGVRLNESNSRNTLLQKADDIYFAEHTLNKNWIVFRPIVNVSLHELWAYLLKNAKNIFSINYALLHEMYGSSNSDVCPTNITENKEAIYKKCGNSRWGCWTCTLVKTDKSLYNMGQNLQNKELILLYNFTALMKQERDDYKNRYALRFRHYKDNSVKFSGIKLKRNLVNNIEEKKIIVWNKIKESDIYKNLNLNYKDYCVEKNFQYFDFSPGCYTLEYRKMILDRLLKLQKSINKKLINDEEINEIELIWKNTEKCIMTLF